MTPPSPLSACCGAPAIYCEDNLGSKPWYKCSKCVRNCDLRASEPSEKAEKDRQLVEDMIHSINPNVKFVDVTPAGSGVSEEEIEKLIEELSHAGSPPCSTWTFIARGDALAIVAYVHSLRSRLDKAEGTIVQMEDDDSIKCNKIRAAACEEALLSRVEIRKLQARLQKAEDELSWIQDLADSSGFTMEGCDTPEVRLAKIKACCDEAFPLNHD